MSPYRYSSEAAQQRIAELEAEVRRLRRKPKRKPWPDAKVRDTLFAVIVAGLVLTLTWSFIIVAWAIVRSGFGG